MDLETPQGTNDAAFDIKTLSRPQSIQDWEDKRSVIESLYCTQDLGLHEVIERMKEHNFLATSDITACVNIGGVATNS